MPIPIKQKLSYAAMKVSVPNIAALNLDFRDESVTYTGITGKSVKIKQKFNYICIFNLDAGADIYVTIHTGVIASAGSSHGVIKIPPLAGYEEKQVDVSWVSLIASAACSAEIILKAGGLE
jgi:hypothetical protein